jgi:hypothetical protein
MSFQDHAPLRSPAAFAVQDGSRERISHERLAAAKAAFTTRRVDLKDGRTLVRDVRPASGDLVLARVDSIGHHARIEAPSGRRRQLYVGDEILVAYGARYAPDQFEAVVPKDLSPCALVAGGGVAGKVLNQHSRVRKATQITPLGLLGDREGRVLNLRRYRLRQTEDQAGRKDRPPTAILIVGTSMNAGKTTAAASLVRGLALAGLRVGAAKLTGTGSGGDLWSMIDAGARQALDFTDMGYPSTQGLAEEKVREIALGLFDQLGAAGHDIAVIEIADGLLQRETALLLDSGAVRARIDNVIFAAGDAMGAASGTRWLVDRGLPVLGISGLVTASPLGRREANGATGLPVFGIDELSSAEFAPKLCLSGDRQSRADLKLCG